MFKFWQVQERSYHGRADLQGVISDANVHVAILSRFPFSARRRHPDDSFELGRRHFRVRRGFAEVGVQVNPGCQFTLLAAHLKSKKMQCRHPAGSGLAVQSRDVIDSSHEQHR